MHPEITHPTIIEIQKRLNAAKETYTNAQINAQAALRAIVNDGTGDHKTLSEAKAVATEFNFDLVLSPALPRPKKVSKARKVKTSPASKKK